jgi:antitoxin HigA-1
MKMHNPPHPGEVLKELCLEPLGLSVTRAAEALGVSRKTLSAILNGRAGISPEMALRLSKAFGTSPESWLNQQMHYDLSVTERQIGKLNVEKLSAAQQCAAADVAARHSPCRRKSKASAKLPRS